MPTEIRKGFDLHQYLDTAEGRQLLASHNLRRTWGLARSLVETLDQFAIPTTGFRRIALYEKGPRGVGRRSGFIHFDKLSRTLTVYHEFNPRARQAVHLKRLANALERKFDLNKTEHAHNW